jgi:uncharacterized protein YpuA (DUF1002 family)
MDESDWERMYGKTPAVYEEKKMIEIQKNYKITLTEDQAQQLYRLLQSSGEFSYGERYDELGFLHDELKKLFDSGIR